MARFFIPNLKYKPDAGDDISPDVLYALEKDLPSNAVVCVGFTAGHREVDLAIFTSVAVHVVESKDKKGYPVMFFKNQGLCLQNESGTWDPIINDRGLGEYANVQANKNAGAVSWDCKENGFPVKTYGYILVPHPAPGSDVSENGDVVRISLGVADLLESIQQRESVIQKKGRSNGYAEADFVAIAQSVFNLHETNVINGYKIGDPVQDFDNASAHPQNPSAYAAGKAFGGLFRGLKLPADMSAGNRLLVMLLFALSNLLIAVGAVGSLLSVLVRVVFDTSIKTAAIFITMLLVGILLRWPVSILTSFLSGKNKKSPETLPAQPKNQVLAPPERPSPDVTPTPPPIPVAKARPLSRRFLVPALIAFMGIVLVVGISLFGSQKACVIGGNLNVRQEPGTSSTLVGTLNFGECVRVNGRTRDSQWLRIGGFPHGGDWISSGYLDLLDVDKLKVVE